MKLNAKSLLERFRKVDVEAIQDESLRAKARKLKAKQAGFTLLELLVVVAILAAIAGTATIALQDTDARASAAAHVAMMDELNKGIRTFRVLNKNTLPDSFDSLIETVGATQDGSSGAATLSIAAIEDVALINLTSDVAEIIHGGGLTELRYVTVDASVDPADAGDCSDLEALIANRNNAVVAGNIFLSADGNGCGYSVSWDNAGTFNFPATAPKVAVWTGGYERVMGEAGRDFDATTLATDGSAITAGVAGAPVLMAVGLGPSSTLFNANDLGGLTSVPVYRHVSETEYNRFVALFNIGTVNATTDGIVAGEQLTLASIVDGAGDTKEEELGEWDGTRNTI